MHFYFAEVHGSAGFCAKGTLSWTQPSILFLALFIFYFISVVMLKAVFALVFAFYNEPNKFLLFFSFQLTSLLCFFLFFYCFRRIRNSYILSLALADLLVIIVCVPLASIVYLTDSWTFGKDLCRVSEFFKDISIGVSVFTLTALSGERYGAIVNPLRKLQVNI